jgi:uncharacterized membrane protein YfcA
MELATFGYIAALFMGVTLGALGGGGSILTVPILVYLFKINPIEATAYSLFIVGLSALFGGFAYFKKDEIDLKVGLLFSLPGFLAVYLVRSLVIPNLPDPILTTAAFTITKPILVMTVFSILMLLASRAMIKTRIIVESSPKNISPRKRLIFILLQGFAVGSISGFVGAGGGFIIIPALVMLVGLSMKRAVGTSLFIISINSLLGFTGDLGHGLNFNWKFLLTIAAIAITGLLLGIQFSQNIPEKSLKKGFGYFILIMGGIIMLDQIKRMH